MQVEIRWMLRSDYPKVLDIEWRAYDDPWTEEDIASWLSKRNCIGLVAEAGGKVCGYVVYTLHKKRLEIVNIAVDPQHEGKGIGSKIIDRLKYKLTVSTNRTEIKIIVSEYNDGVQLFLRRAGLLRK